MVPGGGISCGAVMKKNGFVLGIGESGRHG